MVSAKGGLLDMHHTDYMSTVITDVTAHHCHDQLLSHDQLSQDRQDAQHQSKHHSSSHCHHCMACYSIMLNSQLDMASIRSQPILTIAATRGYLAPVTPQPSKPPIL